MLSATQASRSSGNHQDGKAWASWETRDAGAGSPLCCSLLPTSPGGGPTLCIAFPMTIQGVSVASVGSHGRFS